MREFFEWNDFIDDNQSGFWDGSGTTTAVMKITDDLYNAFVVALKSI